MEFVRKFNRGVTKVEAVLMIGMYICLLILGILQILMRQVFKSPLPWSEGLLTYIFIWSSFIGAAIGMNKMEHFCIDVIVDKLPAKVQLFIERMIFLLLMAVSAFVVYRGTGLAIAQNEINMPMMKATMMWPYLSLPFSFLLIFIHSTANLICSFDKKGDNDVK